MKLLALFGLMLPMFLGVQASAQTLQSYCYSDPKDFKIVQGLNIDKKYPIASVSKLVTSYWALATKGPQFKFSSLVHVTPVENGEFDVHFQGSRDPYFGQIKLHYIISKLNEKGVTKIRNLTFDDNFLYMQELDIERPVLKEKKFFPWKNYFTSPVGAKKTLAELNKGLTENYDNSVKHLAKANIKLLPQVNFIAEDISYLDSRKFNPTTTTKSYAIDSAPLYRLIKEMNRNSNNFAAVEIFKMLGGPDKFSVFIKKQLGLGPDAIKFYEGSGNRVEIKPVYNEATCRALLTIFRELSIVAQKNALDIDDLVSVFGEDDQLQENARYHSDINDRSGVAKTGTSAASMSLGGMLNSKPQRMYFMYNVNPTAFTAKQKKASRSLIATEVKKLSKQFAEFLTEFDYKKVTFVSFELDSFSEILKPSALP